VGISLRFNSEFEFVVSFIKQSFVVILVDSFRLRFVECKLSFDDTDDSRGDGLAQKPKQILNVSCSNPVNSNLVAD
jgi:hypothetical protein